MNRIKLFTIIAFMVVLMHEAFAQVVKIEEASTIAGKWIQNVIDRHGKWGDSKIASVQSVQELIYKNRRIGYVCPVEPHGLIVVSLRKELGPVKLYSEVNDFNTEKDKGLLDLIGMLVFREIHPVENKFGLIEAVDFSNLQNTLTASHRQSWDHLINYVPGNVKKSDSVTEDYQEFDTLLTSRWHQLAPYNNACPDLDCDSTGNGRALVGCVATSTAQIMRYWNWPPYGVNSPYSDTYDWMNMPDNLTTASPAAQQAAVAELCHEVGLSVDMDYGCEASGTITSKLAQTMDTYFRYSNSVQYIYKEDYTDSEWFGLIIMQLNQNRPIEYDIWNGESGEDKFRHAIVCDGYVDNGINGQYYHINMGWEDISFNGWYEFNHIFTDPDNHDNDSMVFNLFPDGALGPSLIGTYAMVPTFPYRYFDRDATGVGAVFSPGQSLQTLPGIVITGMGTSFQGISPFVTKIFTRGDRTKGISVQNGTLKLTNGGSIRLN